MDILEILEKEIIQKNKSYPGSIIFIIGRKDSKGKVTLNSDWVALKERLGSNPSPKLEE